jgi:hypothetical protein
MENLAGAGEKKAPLQAKSYQETNSAGLTTEMLCQGHTRWRRAGGDAATQQDWLQGIGFRRSASGDWRTRISRNASGRGGNLLHLLFQSGSKPLHLFQSSRISCSTRGKEGCMVIRKALTVSAEPEA